MPARFINVNNSGRARFTNVNNSGRAVFGGGGSPAPTTTTVPQAAINIYARQLGITAPITFHYSTDNGSTWNFLLDTPAVSDTCSNIATLTVPQGTSLVLRAGSPTNINAVYSSTRTNGSTVCPAWDTAADACTWPTQTNVPTRDVAFTVNQEQTELC